MSHAGKELVMVLGSHVSVQSPPACPGRHLNNAANGMRPKHLLCLALPFSLPQNMPSTVTRGILQTLESVLEQMTAHHSG